MGGHEKNGDSDWSRNYTLSGTRGGKIKVAILDEWRWKEEEDKKKEEKVKKGEGKR